MTHEPNPLCQRTDQDGFAAIGMVVMLVPLLFTVGSFLQTMTSRGQALQHDVREEKALMAAEAGVDVAMYQARLGLLVNGATYSETVPGGATFTTVCTNLGGDGIDNDGDGPVDGADPDEQVFQVVSTGVHGNARRRVVAYLGFTSFLPTVTAAATVTNPTMGINITGAARINGTNVGLTGAAVGSGDSPGLSITTPGTTANLLSQLTPSEQGKVLGTGGTPSLGSTVPVDVNAIATQAASTAGVVITGTNISSTTYGSAVTPVTAYRAGNVKFTGNTTGYGLLVVTGDLTIAGNFTWNGVVVVLGTLDAGAGTAQIRGGVIMGPSSPLLDIRGTCDLRFSGVAVQLAAGLSGRYSLFNGWQEVSANGP